MYQLLDVAKGFLESMNIKEDYVLCDFTMGNGYDTEYLCKKVPKGKVYAFDIQAQAVENTRKRLSDAGLTNAEIIHDSHAKVLEYVKEPINGGMFNLGYLPGGDKSVHTMRESTMPAIEGAISLLKKGGILVISIYPGHEEGTLEGQMLLEKLSQLSRFEYCVTNFRIINSPDAPFIIAVERYDK
ncbi:MAG: class I SAM-dependent methyltransferase [Clostridia bacterium]|nr:class I SAM-dependent methyltransferase [Clostridia bacterium]